MNRGGPMLSQAISHFHNLIFVFASSPKSFREVLFVVGWGGLPQAVSHFDNQIFVFRVFGGRARPGPWGPGRAVSRFNNPIFVFGSVLCVVT